MSITVNFEQEINHVNTKRDQEYLMRIQSKLSKPDQTKE